MTREELVIRALVETRGHDEVYWRQVLAQALADAGKDIADTGLLDQIPDDEAAPLLAHLHRLGESRRYAEDVRLALGGFLRTHAAEFADLLSRRN